MKGTIESIDYYWSRTAISPNLSQWEQRVDWFCILHTGDSVLSSFKHSIRNLLLYSQNRSITDTQNNTQIPLNMLLEFISAESNGTNYQLLPRGPLSQALSDNVCLDMSRYILTYKGVKMNMLLTNASVEIFDRHQKIQYFNLATTCKMTDYEYNFTMFTVNFSIP